MNFTIHAGERLAIVGVNGAGKSTLVKLMTGLFAPTEGRIYINGVDIAEMKKAEVYELYSAVFQAQQARYGSYFLHRYQSLLRFILHQILLIRKGA